jgi:hypothetical protein
MAPPRKCECGECDLCRHREYQRERRRDPAVRERINAHRRSEKVRAYSSLDRCSAVARPAVTRHTYTASPGAHLSSSASASPGAHRG